MIIRNFLKVFFMTSATYLSAEDEAAVNAAFFRINPEMRAQEEQVTRVQEAVANSRSELETFFGTDQNFLVTNPCSPHWHWTNIKKNPLKIPLYYLIGMVGYTIALPLRICIVAYAAISSIIVLKKEYKSRDQSDDPHYFKRRLKFQSKICAGAVGELVSGVIGIVCPPIAYKIDEWIQSNLVIHAWYKNGFPLSVWFYELQEREVLAGNVGVEVAPNEHRVQLKKMRLENTLPLYKKAHEDLGQFMSQEELDGQMPDVLNKIIVLGFLSGIREGVPLSVVKKEVVGNLKAEQTESKLQELNKKEADFLKYWKTLCTEGVMHDAFSQWWSKCETFPYKGERFTSKNLGKLVMLELVIDRPLATVKDDEYFVNGIQGRSRIHSALMRTYFKEGIEELYKTDTAVAKHIDAYFGVIEPGKETEKINTYSGALNQAKEEAIQYLEEKDLFIMVEIDGERRKLRDVVLDMITHVTKFSHEVCSDREVFGVLAQAAYS